MAGAMGRLDMLWGGVWRSHVVGWGCGGLCHVVGWGGGGLALWREGGRHGLLTLVDHVALVVLRITHHVGEAEGIVVTVSQLLQVVHGHSRLDRFLIWLRLSHSEVCEMWVDGTYTTSEKACLKWTCGCFKHPMW